MPQTGGKDKSSSKRHFTVVIGTKEHGLYCSSSPSSAARKAVSKLCGKEKGKKVEFCLREITQGSKKKTYGPYLGHVEKLAKPIELKGRLIERKPVALLKPKSGAKKGGMRGGDYYDTLQGYTDTEKNYMRDYEIATYSGLQTNYISMTAQYKNIPNTRITELKNIVLNHLKNIGVI
jgi:hypothetical protein